MDGLHDRCGSTLAKMSLLTINELRSEQYFVLLVKLGGCTTLWLCGHMTPLQQQSDHLGQQEDSLPVRPDNVVHLRPHTLPPQLCSPQTRLSFTQTHGCDCMQVYMCTNKRKHVFLPSLFQHWSGPCCRLCSHSSSCPDVPSPPRFCCL